MENNAAPQDTGKLTGDAFRRYWNGNLRGMAPYAPGYQPRITPATIKLNTNENPYPPSPRALEAIKACLDERLRLYPPAEWPDLRRTIAAAYKLDPENVFCGNGSDEVLALVFRSFCDPGDSVLLPYPTYSLYPVLASACAVRPVYVDTRDDFSVDCDALLAARTRIAIIANPNAPTGIALDRARLAAFVGAFPGLVIVDEAYVDFSPAGTSLVDLVRELPNLLVLRTFSKSFSLCGLRVGYAFGSPGLIAGLVAMKDSYNLDLLAQAGARAAIQDMDWMQENARRVIATREITARRFAERGFICLPSAANFIFVRHPERDAAALKAALAEREIHVRHFTDRRIADFLRVSIGTDEQMDRFFAVLDTIAARGAAG